MVITKLKKILLILVNFIQIVGIFYLLEACAGLNKTKEVQTATILKALKALDAALNTEPIDSTAGSIPAVESTGSLNFLVIGGVCLALCSFLVALALLNHWEVKLEKLPNGEQVTSLHEFWPPRSFTEFRDEKTGLEIYLDVRSQYKCFIQIFDPLDERLIYFNEFLNSRNVSYILEDGKVIEVFTRLWS